MKRLDLPVLLMLLLGAAALQMLLAPLPLQVPLLVAVAAYYALGHTLAQSLVVALWAGLLHDAQGGLPPLTSALTLAGLVLLLSIWREALPESNVWLNGILSALGALLLALVQIVVVARGGGGWPLTWQMLWWLLALLPAGMAAGALAWSAAWRLELLAGNIAPRKEVEQRVS